MPTLTPGEGSSQRGEARRPASRGAQPANQFPAWEPFNPRDDDRRTIVAESVTVTRELEYQAVYVFHTHQDELTCPVCASRDGIATTVPNPQRYPERLDPIHNLGDFRWPPLHRSCRCWVTTVLYATTRTIEGSRG